MCKFLPYEKDHYDEGASWIAGVDEAGRGAIAGPVTVGLTIFPPDIFKTQVVAELQGVKDSKRLTPRRREQLRPHIERLVKFSTAIHISNKIIDTIGINAATELAVMQAVRRAAMSGLKIARLLMDGNYAFKEFRRIFPKVDYQAIIRGDDRIFSIAAASIIAKTDRDRRMVRYAKYYPNYELEKHKGYGTRRHRELIRLYGAAPLHRKSYTIL